LCFQSSYIFQLKENGWYVPSNTTVCFFRFQFTASASFWFHQSNAASTLYKHVQHLLLQGALQSTADYEGAGTALLELMASSATASLLRGQLIYVFALNTPTNTQTCFDPTMNTSELVHLF